MSWEEKVTVKKAKVGENIIDQLIENRGKYSSYAPVTDGGHPFDRLVASKDKKRVHILEVKALDKRRWYDDTGISIDHYKDYKRMEEKYNLNVFIFFVDASLGEIYGNYLSKLEEEAVVGGNKYPIIERNKKAIGGKIIYFPLVNMMREIYELNKHEVKKLKKHTEYYGLGG